MRVIHLGAQAGVRYSLDHPHAYIQSNVIGSLNILEGCRHNNVEHLVFASTSSVYGLNAKYPFSVHDGVDHPVSLYGATKKDNELMAHSYAHLYKLPVTGLRFFTVYGPWGRPDMAYFSFAQDIIEGKTIKVFNNGNMQRDFTYIDDVVSGIVAAVDLGAPCEVFNLRNHRKEELRTMIELLEKGLGKEAVKEYLPMQQGDVKVTYADIDHSREKLSFEPKTSLEEGLQHFLVWFKDYYG